MLSYKNCVGKIFEDLIKTFSVPNNYFWNFKTVKVSNCGYFCDHRFVDWVSVRGYGVELGH